MQSGTRRGRMSPVKRVFTGPTCSPHRRKYMFKHLLMALVVAQLAAPSAASIKDRYVHSCECTEVDGHIEIQCFNLAEGWWPGIYPTETSKLSLDHNNLLRVTDTSLLEKGLDNLTKLSLMNCSLTYVDPDAFEGLNRLEWLDLSANKIHGLTKAHFKHNPSLKLVNLAGNLYEECRKLRQDLPGVTFLCGHRLTTSSQEPEIAEASTVTEFYGIESSYGSDVTEASTMFQTQTGFTETSFTETDTEPSTTESSFHTEKRLTAVSVVAIVFSCCLLVALVGFVVAKKLGATRRRDSFAKRVAGTQDVCVSSVLFV